MRRYDSPEHESLRAVTRCLILHFGRLDGMFRAYSLFQRLGVQYGADLSPVGANFARKILEKQLPLRGDFAS